MRLRLSNESPKLQRFDSSNRRARLLREMDLILRGLFERGAHPSAVIWVSVHLNKVIPLPHFSTQECPCSLHSSPCRAGQHDYDLFSFQI